MERSRTTCSLWAGTTISTWVAAAPPRWVGWWRGSVADMQGACRCAVAARSGRAERCLRGRGLLCCGAMVRSPLTGVVDEVVAPEGAHVAAGATVLVVESMKMHHEVHAPRADLAAVLARRRAIFDEGRPEAVARRHATGRRTARENV